MSGLWEKFEEWHDANPHVWGLFVRFAMEAIAVGRPKFSARDIVHRIRWHTNVELRSVDEFKINDHWSPYYARLFVRVYPEYNWLFELREAEEDPTTEERLTRKVPKIVMKDGLPTLPVERPSKAEIGRALRDLLVMHQIAKKRGYNFSEAYYKLGRWIRHVSGVPGGKSST